MKNFVLLLLAFTFLHAPAEAQKKEHRVVKEHRIVFDMAGSDTADHNAIIRQVNNVLRSAPQTKIEVVFHGKSVYALMKDKSTVKDKIDDLVNNKHVIIAACNNSLNQLKLSKDDVIPSAIIVPVAMLELMDKQEKGWSYIKAGH